MATCTSCGHESENAARFCAACGASVAIEAPGREVRKTVTVLFCDVTDSTGLGERLDPESLRHVMARYFDTARVAIERHGGMVEKFIGDAVMAVFGVPVVHEDDALRAVRTAAGLHEALVALNEQLVRDHGVTLQLRIGVNTGEVVAGTEERLVTGDAVNLAARLEQAAAPGEILLGGATFDLVRDAVEAEELPPLDVRGKGKPVAAYRLRSVGAERYGHARRLDVSFVGRERELRMLSGAWERVTAERGCQLFTLLGPPGVGKSRLVAEFLAGVDGARVLQGRCLSYGEGITYWPVVELLVQLLGDDPRTALVDLGLDENAAAQTLALLRKEDVPTTTEETAWGVRKLLEAVALSTPLVVVLDDINWGEPAFLDLVEHIADLSRDAPILLLCMARPELLDRRAGWGGGKLNAATVLLEPLTPVETDQLIGNLLGDETLADGLRTRVRDGADGNPLFVEEMLAMLSEGGNGEIVVPPTIQALLAARLDQLEPAERSVLERGAVEGQVFHLRAVQALDPDTQPARAALTSLVRKELIRPDRAQLAGEDAFRFRHLLIRDAAYESLPKSARADLHERLAAWLEERGPDLVEADEIVGYHLEHAHRYQAELGPLPDSGLAARAAAHLSAAGRYANERGDITATANLLGRALALTPDDDPAVGLRLELAVTRGRSGDLLGAEEAAIEAAERAAAGGDRPAELRARLIGLQLAVDPEGVVAATRVLLEEALPLFEALDDDAGLIAACDSIALIAAYGGHHGEAAAAMERALVHARRLGDRRVETRLQLSIIGDMHRGTAPVEEVLGRLDDEPQHEHRLLGTRAECLARLGRFDEARAAMSEARARLEELGWGYTKATWGTTMGTVETLSGDVPAAERELRSSCEQLEELGERWLLPIASCMLAISLCELGRHDEAETWAQRGIEIGAADDMETQIIWRCAMTRVLAARGKHEEAERFAREAVELADPTDDLIARADTRIDLATLLEATGRVDEAAGYVRQALELYEQKGDLVSARRARARLDALLGGASSTAP